MAIQDRNLKRSTLVAAAAVMMFGLAALGGPARAHDSPHFTAGEPGDPAKPARVVRVRMTERDGKMIYIPNRIDVAKGEQIRFVLENTGDTDHEFLLATTEENLKHAKEMAKNPDMEHDEPNGKRLAPKKTAEIVWKFSKAGEFEYGCLIPGHREAGMIGNIVVR